MEGVSFKWFTIGSNTGEAISKEYRDEDGSVLLYATDQRPIKCNYTDFPQKWLTTENDILVARNGVGAIYNDHVIRFTIKKSACRSYLYYSLLVGMEKVVSEAVQVSLKTLSKSDWDIVPIPECPMHTQIAIAEFLDRRTAEIDGLLADLTRQNEVLLSAAQKYGMYPQNKTDGTVKVKIDTDLQAFKTVHKNDFVISLRSFQGGFEISEYEGVCSPAYQVFFNSTEICHTYWKWFFGSALFIDAMNALTTGIREGRNLPYVDFAQSVMPLPPLKEQWETAAKTDRCTSTIDGLIADINAQIEKMKQYRQIVIHDTVTGKIKVAEG
jgi:restriction endonuclease S subunit